MSSQYNSLDELRRKKELLKREVSDLQNLLTFKDKKESLSAMTHGFTDRFLDETTDAEGDQKLVVKTGEIAKELGQTLVGKSEEKSVINFDNEGLKQTAFENVLRLGGVALAGSLAKKNLSKRSWKNKLLGLAIIYLLPTALRFISKKLEEYQKRRSISSMEQLI